MTHQMIMREKLIRIAGFLGLFSLLLVLASLFSVPFPFVRLIWVHEVWGISGLFHAIIFFILSRRIAEASVIAPLAGVGLILNEEMRTLITYRFLLNHISPERSQHIFCAGALLLGSFLLWMMIEAFKLALRHKTHVLEAEAEKRGQEAARLPISIWALFITGAGYAALAAGLCVQFYLSGAGLYGIFKIFSSLAAIYSFSGVGQEVVFYLEGRQNASACVMKSLTHLFLLCAFLWVIYHQLPIDSVLITG